MKRVLFFLFSLLISHNSVVAMDPATVKCEDIQQAINAAAQQVAVEDAVVLKALAVAKAQFSAITNFGKDKAARLPGNASGTDVFFYRFVEDNYRPQSIKYLYGFNNITEQHAAVWMIHWMKICDREFASLHHNYRMTWHGACDTDVFREYIYNGFKWTTKNFYQAISLITMHQTGIFPDNIEQCLTTLKRNMYLEEGREKTLASLLMILFLSDYLVAANFGQDRNMNIQWRNAIKRFFSEDGGTIRYRFGQYTVASAVLISLFVKSFKGCFVDSVDDQQFAEILENFEVMYNTILRRQHNYMLLEGCPDFNYVFDEGISLLEKFEADGIVSLDRLNTLKQKLRQLRSPSHLVRNILLLMFGGGVLSFILARKYPDLFKNIPFLNRVPHWQLPSFESIFGKSTTKPGLTGKR